MPHVIAPGLIVAAVLLAGGIAKLRTPDDPAGWAELGVPAALRRPWLIRLHPIAELVLALALLLFGGILGVLAAGAATAVLLVYLVMVWRARRRTPDASCACFGTRRPITVRTLLRNGWLVLLSGALTAGIGATPALGGVLVAAVQDWAWVAALGAVAVTCVLLHHSAGQSDPAAAAGTPASGSASVHGPVPASGSGGSAEDGELEEYLRTRTPAVPVQLGDGSTVNLRELSMRAPILLLAVSETCGACTPVIERADAYRELLPELSVRLLLRTAPDQSSLTSDREPQTVHDPDDYVRGSIADWPTPTAVLLGADGLLAGGPVTGEQAIEEFIADVYESLHGVRPPAA